MTPKATHDPSEVQRNAERHERNKRRIRRFDGPSTGLMIAVLVAAIAAVILMVVFS